MPLASAADMPFKAPPSQAADDWSGWYAGGNLGYGWGDARNPDVSFVDPGAAIGFAAYFAAGGNVIPGLTPRGINGGGQVGFNRMLAPHWLVGAVADLQASAIAASATNSAAAFGVPTLQSNSSRIDWFGTVRGKIGVTENNWLLFGTAGLAYGAVTTSGSFITPGGLVAVTGANTSTSTGWAAGAGVNYSLSQNWIAGIEYIYVNLGRTSATETQPLFPGAALTISNLSAVHVLRTTLDYRF